MTAKVFAAASAVALAAIILTETAQAQGSMGGSVGVQEKSVSGDREAPRSLPPPSQKRAAPAPEPRRAPPPRRGGGGNYDGNWYVTNVGCGGVPGTATISGGRVSGGGVSGSVSGNGAVRTASAVSVGWGQISGNRASGGFRTNDGCTGRWSAVRQ